MNGGGCVRFDGLQKDYPCSEDTGKKTGCLKREDQEGNQNSRNAGQAQRHAKQQAESYRSFFIAKGFQCQKGLSQHHEGHVMMPAFPVPPFVMIQTQFFLSLLVMRTARVPPQIPSARRPCVAALHQLFSSGGMAAAISSP